MLVGFLGAAVAVLPALCQTYTIATVAGGGLPTTPAPATNVPIMQPYMGFQGLTFAVPDAFGNLYLTASNCVFKMDATGILTRVAGRSVSAGYSGNGGQALDAVFDGLGSLAVDGAGNIYVADSGNSRIRKVTVATGIITTVAGTGRSDFFGDGGPATSADLNQPRGVALDGAGNLFIADTLNFRIRKVSAATGTITTVAGTGSQGHSSDGIPATTAPLFFPTNVAADGAGNCYIIDAGTSKIRKVTATTGIITTVAGNGNAGILGDGGPATAAEVWNPAGAWVDGAGNLFIADGGNNRIREVSAATGIITTVAGKGTEGYLGDGGPALDAELDAPNGVSVDGAGNLYIADYYNYRVRKVSVVSGISTITTVAGNGSRSGPGGDGGPALSAQLNLPLGTAVDGSGNLYIADSSNNLVRKVVSSNGIITTAAGNGSAGYSGDGGQAASASLSNPQSVAVDGLGNLYIGDNLNGVVRKVTVATGIISTVAGDGTFGYSDDGGSARGAQLASINGVAVDGAGNLYIADSNRIRKVTAATGIITTVAGSVSNGYSGDGGPATSALLNAPLAVAVDSAGNLYIGDSNRVRKVVAATGIISTVAGNGTSGYSGDGGPAISAQVSPAGVAVDTAGNIYIAGAFAVRKIAAATGIITTVGGNGASGYSGDGGPATSAEFGQPQSVAVDGAGNLYIADESNNVVRILAPSATALLIVTKTHAANFVAGQSGAAYTVTVSDAPGAGSTNGAVTVSEIVPAGLTLQSMSGIGWNCPLSGNTCTRSDALSGGNSYAPITVSVNVASNAGAQVINQVTVTGGGAAGTSASDMTNILRTPVQLLFAAQPAGGPVGTVLSPVVVQVEDTFGNVVTGSTASVTVTSSPAGVSATVNVVDGVATFSNLVFNAAGTYTLTATSTGLPSATSSTFNIVVLPSVVIETPAAGAVVNPGTLVVSGWTMDNTAAIGTAIKSVQVMVDGTVVGNATYGINRQDVCNLYPGRPGCPNVGYTYSLSTTGLGFGVHTITVSATDSDAVPDTGTISVTFTLARAATAVSVASSPNPSTLGQSVTLTATVALPGASGAVTFYDGTTILGRKTLVSGQASLTTRLLPAGARSITAYSAGITSASSIQTVNAVPAMGFSAPVSYYAGPDLQSVAVGDFNGDGISDLVVAAAYDGISVLLGNGDGSFKPAVTYAVGEFSEQVVVADFNGDGKPDVAVSDALGYVSVLLGNGDGSFQPPAATGVSNPAGMMAVGDFNGDGIADLAVTNYNGNTVSVFLGNGDGTFQRGLSSIAGNQPFALVVADFNGDGHADLAVAGSSDGTVNVLFGNGDGTFRPPVTISVGGYSSMAVGDFNGDGIADLAVLNGDDVVSVLLGNDNGTFRSPVNYYAGLSAVSVAVGDVNGDGKTDLVVLNDYLGSINVLLGNGDGSFQPLLEYEIVYDPSLAVMGDFNGDGRTDLAFTSWGSDLVTILLGSSGPAQLKFTTQPVSGGAGIALSAVVQVQDTNGSVVTGSSAAVTITSNPAGVSATVNAVNGVATFSNLVFNAAGSYTLTATSPGLASTTSHAFAVSVLPLVVIESPAAGAGEVSGSFAISGWAMDNTSIGGTAVSSVQIQVDGIVVGNATYGVSRPDICATYPGRSGCPNVGFTFQLNRTLTIGLHTITVLASDSASVPGVGSANVTVAVNQFAMLGSKVGVFRNGSSFLEDSNA